MNVWLGRKVDSYVPIATSGFGDLFYYRKLTESDEDVCVLDPHYRRIESCTWNIMSFFNDYLCDSEIQETVLRKNLFEESIVKFDKLDYNEIFFFAPALAIGGGESVDFINKGNCMVQLDILFQITQ